MSDMTQTEAAAERAAIRAELAAKTHPAEVKEPKFTPADGGRAAAARRAVGPVELSAEDATPAARPLNSRALLERDYSRLERAQLAADMKRTERAIRRIELKRAARAAEARRLGKLIIAEVPAHAEAMAAAAGESKQLDYARQLAEAAAILGVSEAEAAETVAAAIAYQDVPKAARPARGNVGYASTSTPAELAAARAWTADMLATPAAVAGRAALDAIGPRAAGLVLSNEAADTLTIARSVRVPSAGVAAKRAEAAAAELAEVSAKLAAAELAVTAARGRKAKRPIDAAEADANRYAAARDKAAGRAAMAAKLDTTAAELAALNLAELEAFIGVPVATFKLAEAAAAGTVSLRVRADVMPAQFRHNGPTAKPARGKSDPTGDSAAALADGYRAELAKVEAAALKLAEATSIEAARAAGLAEVAERHEAYKSRQAEALRVKRAAARAGKAMANHGKARNAKRAAR